MLNNKKAVIFDLDGTLVDSMWMWKQIDIDYLGRFGIECPDDIQDGIEGMSFTETATYFKNRFELPDSIDKIKSDWNEMANYIYMNEIPLKPGVLEFLSFLKANGIKTGIATSNSKELVTAVVKSLNVEFYFDDIRTSCEAGKGKPAPDIYLLVASDLGVDPKDCLVFEDLVLGIQAGKNAGMEVCAVYDEFSKEFDTQKKELADYYITSFDQVRMTKDEKEE